MLTVAKVAEHFGGPSKLAEALGISRQAVDQWEIVPRYRAVQIEMITGGALRAADMNPDALPAGAR